ncbi:MAG: hypothetical protein ACOH1O_06270 [Flavobacterium sp.]
MKYLSGLIMLFSILCCNKSIEDKAIEYDFSSKSFETNQHSSVIMLNVYDVISIKKLTDSLLLIDLEVFKGWKEERLRFSDTLKLTDKIRRLDSFGNQTEQVLSYSKDNQVFFQLNVGYSGIRKTYNYRGKLFIKNSELNYFCDNLYVK